MAKLPADTFDSRNEAAPSSVSAGGLPTLLRDVFSGGLAGLTAGIVFIGAGSRLVMRGVALLNPDSRGLITDNENVIGEITAGGTVELVVGTGLFGGLVAGALWVIVRDWLPARPGARVVLAGVLAALLGSFLVDSRDNEDFRRLDAAALNIALFVAIIGLTGAATAVLDAYVQPRLPAGRVAARVYAPLVLLAGLPTLLLLIVVFLLGDDETHNEPPRIAGLFLIAVALATCVGWRRYFRTAEGATGSHPWQRRAASAALVAAALFGAIDLAGEINAIL